jgi:hypothetical protein
LKLKTARKLLIIFGGIYRIYPQLNKGKPKDVDMRPVGLNVPGEPVFSVMAAGWFCEKSG